MGGFAGTQGLAPWLTQGSAAFSPMGRSSLQLGSGQAAKLAQQRALADQLRAAPVQDYDLWKNPKGSFGDIPDYEAPEKTYAPPEQEGVPSSSPDALDPGYQDQQFGAHMDYSGDVPTVIQGPQNKSDPYNFGPDYSDFYNKAHGAGSYDSEAARYAGLDKEDQLGDYEQLYGEFPEADPTAMEDWFRRAGTGGTDMQLKQNMVAQNQRTELTEAIIPVLLSMGMAAITAPAAAGSLAGAATDTVGSIGAGTAAGGGFGGGGFSLGSLIPSMGQVASSIPSAAYNLTDYYDRSGGY
jgi:hypothetical protein